MTDEERELKKLQMLMNAIDTLDQDDEDDEPDFYGELKQAGWNILHENPGTDCGDWISMLMEQYPMEVVDALGTNPFEVERLLVDMWDCNDWEDEETGECHSLKEWAEYFATDRSVELYDMLVEAKRKISLLEALIPPRQ